MLETVARRTSKVYVVTWDMGEARRALKARGKTRWQLYGRHIVYIIEDSSRVA